MIAPRIPVEMLERARARDITAELGGHFSKLRQIRSTPEYVGACPKCGGDDRFSINVKKQCWHCRHCKPADVKGDVIGLIQFLDGCDFVTAVERLSGERAEQQRGGCSAEREPRRARDEDTGSIEAARRLWREAGPLEGTLGVTYLERDRGIFGLPPADVLRFHPHCISGKDNAGKWQFHPCIIALYRDLISNEPTGVHRIALRPDGKLIRRMGLGGKQGSAVKLWQDVDVGAGLAIGEGVESVLAAAMHVEYRGTLLRPAWSLIDAGNLQAFPILPGIEHLTVLADADENGRGQDAARSCAKRWAEAGRTAEVLIPDELGQDFNDIARQRQKRQVAS